MSVVQSGHVIPFFASTEPQEFNYDIGVHNKTRHCALRHILRPDIFLVSVVQSRLVIPFFASAEPQKFNYDIDIHNKTLHCALRPI